MKTPSPRNGIHPAMHMADLLDADYALVGVFARMGLRLGFGEQSVQEVCQEAGVDAGTFLMLCRMYVTEGYRPSREELQHADLNGILDYLRNSHSYYTDSVLPALEDALRKMVRDCEDLQKNVLWRFFNEYKAELQAHFRYEEETVFPYVEKMLNSEDGSAFTIGEYEQNHSNVEEKLADLKNLIMMYFPPRGNRQEAYSVLAFLFSLEQDLRKHTHIEDDILVPMVMRMEEVVAAARPEGEELSVREKEILISVAKGMLNKEIADRHNISVYTVITHRKNITRKTGIKTVAGLTVYALLNKLIDMNTVE